jgi:hypothetical protein
MANLTARGSTTSVRQRGGPEWSRCHIISVPAPGSVCLACDEPSYPGPPDGDVQRKEKDVGGMKQRLASHFLRSELTASWK